MTGPRLRLAVAFVPLQTDGAIVRAVGLAAVVAIAAALLYAVLSGERPSDDRDDREEGDASLVESFLRNPGTAYVAQGTRDVAMPDEDPDGEADDSREGGEARSGGDAADGRERARRSGDRSEGLSHEVLGERGRGLAVDVTDGARTEQFFVDTDEYPASVTPAAPTSPHGEEWVDEAEAYLIERAAEGTLRPDRDSS